MKRLIVYFNGDSENFINIRCDWIEVRDGFVYAHLDTVVMDNALVGIFDMGCINIMYLSEVKS